MSNSEYRCLGYSESPIRTPLFAPADAKYYSGGSSSYGALGVYVGMWLSGLYLRDDKIYADLNAYISRASGFASDRYLQQITVGMKDKNGKTIGAFAYRDLEDSTITGPSYDSVGGIGQFVVVDKTGTSYESSMNLSDCVHPITNQSELGYFSIGDRVDPSKYISSGISISSKWNCNKVFIGITNNISGYARYSGSKWHGRPIIFNGNNFGYNLYGEWIDGQFQQTGGKSDSTGSYQLNRIGYDRIDGHIATYNNWQFIYAEDIIGNNSPIANFTGVGGSVYPCDTVFVGTSPKFPLTYNFDNRVVVRGDGSYYRCSSWQEGYTCSNAVTLSGFSYGCAVSFTGQSKNQDLLTDMGNGIVTESRVVGAKGLYSCEFASTTIKPPKPIYLYSSVEGEGYGGLRLVLGVGLGGNIGSDSNPRVDKIVGYYTYGANGKAPITEPDYSCHFGEFYVPITSSTPIHYTCDDKDIWYNSCDSRNPLIPLYPSVDTVYVTLYTHCINENGEYVCDNKTTFPISGFVRSKIPSAPVVNIPIAPATAGCNYGATWYGGNLGFSKFGVNFGSNSPDCVGCTIPGCTVIEGWDNFCAYSTDFNSADFLTEAVRDYTAQDNRINANFNYIYCDFIPNGTHDCGAWYDNKITIPPIGCVIPYGYKTTTVSFSTEYTAPTGSPGMWVHRNEIGSGVGVDTWQEGLFYTYNGGVWR